MTDENDSFLRQIDEEVRREKLKQFWDKYGVILVSAIAAVLVTFGGWRLYQSETIKAAKTAGAQFAEASELLGEKDKQADALRAFETIAKSGPSGYAMLAKLKLAAQARSENKNGEALKHYEAVAKDSSADKLFSSFAKLQIASLKLDDGSFTEVKNQLNDLIKDESPWRHTAREIFGLAALKAGKFDEARQTFQALLTAKDAPQALSQRAHIAMAMITREELKAKAPAAPKSEPADKPKEAGGSPAQSEPGKNDGASKPADAKKPQ